jgi:hypothetical protein
MVLAPWNAPEPLARAWCLFELYATVVEGRPFSVCFGPAERQKFEAALDCAVARINVADAQAGTGKQEDLRMILDEVLASGWREASPSRGSESTRWP